METTQTPTASRRWFVVNQADGSDEATIKIYEDIGYFGVTAKQFADELEKIEAKKIHLRLNTYGGEFFDGVAIFNALQAHPAEVTVHIDGVAASAGSIIAMAGAEILMADNAYMMIHNTSSGVMGGADDMRREADLLDKLNDTIAMMYQARAGKTRKYWRDKMDAETWFTADEAKEEGLADTVEVAAQAENRFDFRIYNNVPDAARKLWGKPTPPNSNLTSSAPEETRSSVSLAPVHTTEVIAMSDTATAVSTATPAQPPAAGNVTANVPQGNPLQNLREQEIQGYVDQGKRAGRKEMEDEMIQRCKAIADACPGKPDLALKSFLSRHSPESVKLAFEEAKAEREASDARFQQLQEESRRAVALAAAGGYPGGVPSAMDAGGEPDPDMTPEVAKATAEREWDKNPAVRKGFSSKQRYVNVRSAELRGQFKGKAAQPA